jgi:hypothetical protein
LILSHFSPAFGSLSYQMLLEIYEMMLNRPAPVLRIMVTRLADKSYRDFQTFGLVFQTDGI